MRAPRSIALATLFGFLACAATAEQAVSFEEKRLSTIPEAWVKDWSRVGCRFSPDGRSVACVGREGAKCFMVVNGKKGPEFEVAGPAEFSPDGTRLVYIAQKTLQGAFVVVVGDEQSEEFDKVESPIFSPDGKIVAYGARKGAYWFMHVGGKTGVAFDRVGPPVFGSDGKTVIYSALKDGKQFSVLGETKGEDFDQTAATHFCPDGKTGTCMARNGKKWFIVVGEKKGEEFDEVHSPVHIDSDNMKGESPLFSPDGTKLAYGARKGQDLWWKVLDVK